MRPAMSSELVKELRSIAERLAGARAVTDAMVEAALKSLHSNPVSWEHPETIRAALTATLAEPAGEAEPDFAASIAEVIKEESLNEAACGWRSCTGCHETNEGYETGRYPYSAMFGCHVGHGCSECGGLGVVWDYWSKDALDDMARDVTTPPDASAIREANRPDYDVSGLLDAAWAEVGKAMRKFPQPNYVISKVAEEAGEVVKAAIHCAEGRDTPEHVAAEIKQAIAMLIRLYVEGDQVHGLPPIRAALAGAKP